MRININKTNIISFVFFLSFVISMYIWIGWENRSALFNIAFAFFLLMWTIQRKFPLRFTRRNTIAFILLLLPQLILIHNLKLICSSIVLFYIVFVDDDLKVVILEKITKWFAYLLVPGIIIYLLLKFIKLPSLGIIYNGNNLAENYGVCENYIFYVQSYFGNYIDRFNGPFLEPGHLGMMAAFLLFVNKFKVKSKPYLWILIIAILLSLSLAGYILLLAALLMTLFYNEKMKIRYTIVLCGILLGGYLISANYNGGNNFVNNFILTRLEYDEQSGNFAGNNRVFGRIPAYYEAMYNDYSLLLTGYSSEVVNNLAKSGSRGTGYKMWMVRYGIIGTILAFLFYFYYAYSSKVKKFSFLLLIFVIAMFWQRCYPFWSSWIICFMYGNVVEERGILENRNP